MNLVNTCSACGSEEGLDSLLARMIEDNEVRMLIADVLRVSLPLGMLVTRYLRLFKPASQKLRMKRAGEVLRELLPDLQRGAIDRKGREWTAPLDTWRAAFEAVFENQDAGRLTLPLQDNGYLYGVIVRMVDQHEADRERNREEERKHRPHVERQQEEPSAAPAVAALRMPAIDLNPPRVESPHVRRVKAEIAQRLAERGAVPAGQVAAMDDTAGITPSNETAPQGA